MQIIPLIKELFYLRGKISPTMIERFSLGGKNSIIIKKRVVLKSEGNTENKSFSFLAKL